VTVKQWLRTASSSGEIELRQDEDTWALLIKPKGSDAFRTTATGSVSGAAANPIAAPAQAVQVGTLRVDPDSRLVSLNGNSIHVTPREFELLWSMIQQPSKVFSKDELDPAGVPPRSHLYALRRKLPGFIHTRPGFGWSLVRGDA
jgi:DNA-binding response OmpR family regulator